MIGTDTAFRHLATGIGAAALLIAKKIVNTYRNRVADEIAFWVLAVATVAMVMDVFGVFGK